MQHITSLRHVSALLACLFFMACGTTPTTVPIDSTVPLTADTSNNFTGSQMTREDILISATIEQSSTGCSLVLPERIWAALRNYDTTFQTWSSADFVKSCDGNKKYFQCNSHQLPYAVIGDFNGDSINDLALLGHNKGNTLLVGVLSEEDRFSAMEVGRFPLTLPQSTWIDNEQNTGLWMFMEYCSPERAATSRHGINSVKHDAFLYGTCGKGYSIYWFADGKFHKGTFSD